MNALLGETKEEPPISNGVDEEDTIMHDSSDLSDISASEGGSETASAISRTKVSSRQKDLRQKAQNQAHAKQREAARAQAASYKQAVADHRRLDEEVNKLERRLEGIEREFRKLLGAVRVKPLGRDRFYNRIWWFDGLGSASLLGSGGVVQYGAGRIFIQGPSEFDVDLLEKRVEEDLEARRKEEEGDEGMLAAGEWAVYSDLEEVCFFLVDCLPELPILNDFNFRLMNLSHGSIQKAIASLPSRTLLRNGGLILPPGFGNVLLFVMFLVFH
jgi:hypothetical protein